MWNMTLFLGMVPIQFYHVNSERLIYTHPPLTCVPGPPGLGVVATLAPAVAEPLVVALDKVLPSDILSDHSLKGAVD